MDTKSAFQNFISNISSEQYEQFIIRVQQVNRDIKRFGIRMVSDANGEPISTNARLLTGYSYGEFYDWDLYFENIYLSYFAESRYCRNNVEAFLDRQMECGFVARTLIQPRMRQHFKPFLAQIALLGCKQRGNYDWLIGKYYDRLKKYLDYWFYYCDFDKNGLCVWDSADHSGMDNQILRAGKLDTMAIEGVDLNCYLYRELLAMAAIADRLGQKEDQIEFQAHAQRLANLINSVFWDDEDGFYYDHNEKTDKYVLYRSIAGFLPIWAGIAPDGHAQRLIEKHLLNTEEFWLRYPVATWAKDQRGYYQQKQKDECNWMGPCWIPLNYLIFHGLIDYGYDDAAKELAYRTFHMVLNEADTREYYNAETGCGQGLNPFWGWSALAYFMPLEFELKYDPMKPDACILPIAVENLNIMF
ncbi:MAG: hypothetical protein PWQ93_110 [Clostridiales bacterium]|nr:hypothetical protein [Clostridiales bacterium]